MKYSSPSCHSSRSLAPYIIQEGEGGCIEERKGTNRDQGRRQKKDERRPEGFHRGNCEDGMDERDGGRMITLVGWWAPVGSVRVP